MQQRQHLYLIFKEAVNNMLKYAAATNVLLLIAKETNEIRMLIKDDGKGFAMPLSSSGNGVKNMQFRAAALGGKLLIESTIGKGTAVTLHFPIT
jgi:signal transduction histidine kinase